MWLPKLLQNDSSIHDSHSPLDLRPLYRWYAQHKRSLPFRGEKDAYTVWVSETMLQQTRMSTILGHYQRFIQLFPDILALAKAPQSSVLQAWQGLGYYSRARNLHKGAQLIQQKYNGHFPKDWDEALSIPGVGPYTAAAVLSIAYGLDIAVLDGNVKRILARLYRLSVLPPDKVLQRLAQNLMEQCSHFILLRKATAGVHNQALMELGALLCTPQIAHCVSCPLQKVCTGYQQMGSLAVAKIPKLKKKQVVELKLKVWFIICMERKKKKVLLLKQSHSRFLKNLWFFPYHYSPKAMVQPPSAPHFPSIIRQLNIAQEKNLTSRIQHRITHHKISVEIKALWCSNKTKHVLGLLEKSENIAKTFENDLQRSDAKKKVLKKVIASTKKSPQNQIKTQWSWVDSEDIQEYLVSSLPNKILRAFTLETENLKY